MFANGSQLSSQLRRKRSLQEKPLEGHAVQMLWDERTHKMENSSHSVENVETQIDAKADDQENEHTDENYRQEIEDIVTRIYY
ncbi:hypothetical protein ACROYT_G002060 [Oculina patagonica]